MESSLLAELSNSLKGVLNAAKVVHEKGEITPDDIEKLYVSGFITVKFYDDANELCKDYNLTAENLKAAEEEPVTFQDKRHGRLYF